MHAGASVRLEEGVVSRVASMSSRPVTISPLGEILSNAGETSGIHLDCTVESEKNT